MDANPLSPNQLAAVAELCRTYGVRRLAVFGSAAKGTFDPEKSDLDFVVEFNPSTTHGPADQFFGFMEELEKTFGRKVDLVDAQAIRNPYFREEVEETAREVYAA